MARNLVEEKDRPANDKQITPQPFKQQENEVKVITDSQLLIYKLDELKEELKEISNKMLEGFKQVGVKFE